MGFGRAEGPAHRAPLLPVRTPPQGSDAFVDTAPSVAEWKMAAGYTVARAGRKRAVPELRNGPVVHGSPNWTRTSNLAVNSRSLYQLSYRGILCVTRPTYTISGAKVKSIRRFRRCRKLRNFRRFCGPRSGLCRPRIGAEVGPALVHARLGLRGVLVLPVDGEAVLRGVLPR